MGRKVVIVGGVAAGASAATHARRLDEQAEIVMFERSGYVSFANCGLPYYIGEVVADRQALLAMTPEQFEKRFRIRAHIRHEVIRIDREAHQVEVRNLKSGRVFWESYDKLILTPGARPIVPPDVPMDAENVFTLRTFEDMDRIRAFVDRQETKNALLIGGGFIGVELAETLTQRGVQVTMVEKGQQLLSPFDPDMAGFVSHELQKNGVTVRFGVTASEYHLGGGGVCEVGFDDGSVMATDLLILSIGVRPNVSLASEAGLTLGPRGGIAIDAHMQTSDTDILAAGDAVEVMHAVTGEPSLVPLAGPASRMGRLAGEFAVTDRLPLAPTVTGTAIVKAFNVTAAITGLTVKAARRSQIPFETAIVQRPNHVAWYPGATAMTIKLLYTPKTGELLGAQIVGGAGVDRRIDVIATALHFGGTIDDLGRLDLAYAPQFGAAKDPVHMAAFVAQNQECGLVRHLHPEELAWFSDKGGQLVDVRTAAEHADGTISGSVHIPVDDLRDRLGELDRAAPILVYCKSGQRAYAAVRILAGAGFENVASLAGGYDFYAEATEPGRLEVVGT
jgi:NADPH-dependent 2,4-dienoyl-CoA reductase/sulfur reductase-like enzyme/rhodanese-related sulfurtransferase